MATQDKDCSQPVEPTEECLQWHGFAGLSVAELDQMVERGLILKYGNVYYVKRFHHEYLDTCAPWGPGVTRKVEGFSG